MSFYDHFSEKELAGLRGRAERVANAPKTIREGEITSALVIQIGSETYALLMEALTAVYEGHAIIPVPGTPSFVAGIANVRGHVLPVLDLAALLGISSDVTNKRALVVASNAEMSVALCAEAVGEVTTILTSTLQATPATLHHAYLQGVLPNGMALLDIGAILSDPTLIVDEVVN